MSDSDLLPEWNDAEVAAILDRAVPPPSLDAPNFDHLSHAGDYGFYNLPGEPWHWSVDGR